MLALAVIATLPTACGSDDAAPTPDVTPAEAFTAIVRWEVAQHVSEPDENGDVDLPVIYLRAESGGTVDIGVQADVVEATADDDVVVRFSDESDDSLNEDLDGVPVKDDGVLFIVGDIPTGETTLEADVRRYQSVEVDTTLQMRITSSDDGAEVTEATERD